MLQAGRSRAGDVLLAAGRATTGSSSRRRVQRALVGGEIALAMVLLVGAGLLLRSFDHLMGIERGYDTRGVTNVTVQAWGYYPTPESRASFVALATARLRETPGVVEAAVTSSLPLAVPIGMERTTMRIEGQPDVPPSALPSIRVASTSPGYFGVMRTPLRAGRAFGDADGAGATPVVIVNEAFAHRYWPGLDPVGKRVTLGFMSRPVERTVVGVVADTRHEGLAADPAPMAFLPYAQAPTGALQFVVRSSMDGAAAARAIRETLASINGTMPLSEITSLDTRLADSMRERRFQLAMLGAFAVTALLLAAIGIFGMMSYMTTERTREIGVRVAVGAVPSDVTRMVLGQGARLAALSIVAGVAGAMALTRLMAGMLHGVPVLDPVSYGAAALLLVLVAGVACWVPARRAARIDPIVALRTEQ